MIQVLFVCLGNICRSPMAEGVFRHLVEEAGLAGEIAIDSAGTGIWHVGEEAHSGTRQILRQHGIRYSGRARQVKAEDFAGADYVVAMDGSNLTDLRHMDRRGLLDGKLQRLTDFGPAGLPKDVPDPFYEGNFEYVYELVEASSRGLLDHIRAEQGL